MVAARRFGARFLGSVPVLALAAAAVVALPSVSTAGPASATVSSTLVISEFRLRGPSGANDEFIEVQNISAASLAVADTAAGAGYAIAASSGAIRCTIPNGTVIPRFGHYLCVGNTYSLALYPAGNGTTATGDATFATDIPDNSGIALFNTTTTLDLAHRLDAVGPTTEANTLYKEGTGYPALTPFSIDYSFYRNLSSGTITSSGLDTTTPGISVDTNDNASDFVFVDTNGTSAGAGQRLGAPGPENHSSPVVNGGLAVSLLDPCVDENTAPNAVYDTTSVPAQNATFGSVEFRRTITNNTGGSVSRLRVRIADERTFPAPSGTADMRDRTSTTGVVTVDRVPCGSSTSSVTVVGTTLEVPPAEPNGSAFNSTLGVSTVTLLAPLAAGASVDMRMNFGIQQTGADSARIVVEAVTDGTVSKPSLTCVGMTSTTVLTNFCTNAAPVATMDTYSVLANTALVVPTAGVLSNDTDADLQTVTVDSAATTTPSHGTLTLDADGSFTYTPTAGYSGPDSFTYKATDGTLDSNAATVEITVNPVAPQSFGAFIPMAPQRLLDTRSAGTPLPGGSIQQLHVAGREGIPDDAMAAVLNLTATGSTASGFLTVFPCGTAAPDASNLNFAAGETIANAATSTIGTNGNVCIYTNVTVSLIVDLNGAFSPTAGSALLTPMSPRRLLDTRFTGTKVAANTVQELMIAGVDGVPADATAAALNVTATGATSNGFMTVFPCGTAVPDASNLNFAAGETAANSVTATIGANGRVCFYTTATTDLIVDLNAAYNPTGSAWLQAVAAHRLLDTRVGGQQIAAGSVQQIQVAGSNGAPANAVAAVLNITATETGGAGFITVYPCGSTVPDVSNLNFAAGETVANSVTATVGTNGNVCFYTNAPIHLIVDFDAGFVVLT